MNTVIPTNSANSNNFRNKMIPLSRLSNQELELTLKDLVSKERRLLHVILIHIKEVETRRLYLERAHSSLFEYLVKELGYSGSAAMRRIEAARLLKEIPSVAQKIQEGSLNLSQIGELSRAIKEKERTTGEKVSTLKKEDLVATISGKSTPETQRELCSALNIEIKEQERQRVQKEGSVRLELTLTREQYQKLSQCRDLLAHLLQQGQKDFSWAAVLETLADQYLNKKKTKTSPPEFDVKADSGNDAGNSIAPVKVKAKINSSSEITLKTKPIAAAVAGCGNKSLTPKMKAKIFRRDRCCQFEDPLTQKKCGSTFGLQIDHRHSRWAGGDYAESNLQLLCQEHNRLKYRKEAGIRFVSL